MLMCSKCDAEICDTYSSPTLETSTKPSPFTINDTLVLFFNRLGLGHTAVKEFCGILGTLVMQLKTFQKKEKKIRAKAIEVTNEVLQRSPANKEPFLNQLTHVILVHNWYRSTSTCFHVYSREYTCSVCCHEFDTCRTGSELVRFHWYVSSREFT